MTSSDKSFNLKSAKIVHMEPQDLEAVNKFMEIEHYDVGLTNFRIYYNCSNTKLWKLLRDEKGEIIAIDICNLLPNGVSYGYILIVKPELRGKGISNLFKVHWAEHPNMGSESLKSVSIYSDIFQCWRGKMLVFYGLIPKQAAQAYALVNRKIDIQIERITEKNVSKIYAYDKALIKFDRKKFLKEWCCTEDSQAVVATKNGKVVGFGVLRNFTGFNRYSISPLYADDDNAATAIFAQLAGYMESVYLYLPAQSHQRVSIHFCQSLSLKFMNSEVRDCDLAALNYVKTIDMNKVYTTHDYWPI